MYNKLFRRRLIPNECVELKDDIILYSDDDILVTKWNTLKPRSDFHHGYSCYFWKDGIKVSQFLREDNSLFHWYCDIITCDYNVSDNSLTIIDLLADVTIDEKGHMNVLDLDELCEAKEKDLISEEQFFLSVKQLGNLISVIQSGNFDKYTEVLLKYAK